MGNQQPGGGGGGGTTNNANVMTGHDPHHHHHHHHNQPNNNNHPNHPHQSHQQQQQYGGARSGYPYNVHPQAQAHNHMGSSFPHHSNVAPPGVSNAAPMAMNPNSLNNNPNNPTAAMMMMPGSRPGHPQTDHNTTGTSHRANSDASMTILDNNTVMGLIKSNSSGNNGVVLGNPKAVSQQLSFDSTNNNLNNLNNTNNDSATSGTNNNNNNNIHPALLENWLDGTVPTVFRWEHGGRQVYITGTFNGWSRQIPMHRSGNDFTYIHNLKRGKHAFKFIVDDEWRFAPDQPTVADIEGRINNFIDVTSFKPYTGDKDFEKEKAAAEYGVPWTAAAEVGATAGDDSDVGETGGTPLSDGGAVSMTPGTNKTSGKPDRDGEVFTTVLPDMDEYTKEPPPLPPHLRHIILNKPPQRCDTAALPVPQHVALNHLYCTAIKDNMMVLGITQRYKTKFVTTVYYSPCGK